MNGTVRSLLQLLSDCLWPVHPKAPGRRVDPDVYLRPLIVLVIVVLCGPEVFAAVDLVLLLDLFGVALFLTAFMVGYRALGLAALTCVQRILFPDEWTVFVKMRRHPSTMAHGVFLIGINALRVSVVCAVALVGVVEVARQVV